MTLEAGYSPEKVNSTHHKQIITTTNNEKIT
jgi:hypothetical protein